MPRARFTTVIWLLCLAALAPGCGREEARPSVPRPTDEPRATDEPGWTTYRSAERGYAVSFPEGWERATESLTPNLTEPREILSLGTYPLGYAQSSCAHVPVSALEGMGEDDVFVTIQERGGAPGSEWSGFPPRPERFEFEPDHGSEAAFCVDGPVRFEDHWFGFTDAGRHFHVEVVLGTSASPERRRQAYRVLDTLWFDPGVTPDWRASP